MKRLLTVREINNILDQIDSECCKFNIPAETQQATNLSIKNNLREQLETTLIHPNGITQLKQEIINFYHASQIHPGASVGIITAQSIGERQTQMTLNTFHSAGMAIATVITGVPRFGELLNATSNPKMVSCQIYCNDQDHDLDSLRKYIGSDLRQFTLKDLETTRTIHRSKTSESWYQPFLIFNPIATINDLCGSNCSSLTSSDSCNESDGSGDSDGSDGSDGSGDSDGSDESDGSGDSDGSGESIGDSNYVCVSIKLNKKMMFEYSISMAGIAGQLQEEYSDILIIYSPIEFCQIDIFVDITQINQVSEFIDESIKYQIYLDNIVIPALYDIVVCGVPGVKNFFYKRYMKDDKNLQYLSSINSESDHNISGGWMVETQGANFTKLLAHPKFKTNILISNNMWDIYHALGVEAARQFLIDEFMNVVSSDGTYINICHVMLLVDLMTFAGSIASISRYGVKRDQAGPLAKASFEESLDNFLKAGVFGDIESCNGISASIMCGKRSKIGTGLCDLLYNIDGLHTNDNKPGTLKADHVIEHVTPPLNGRSQVESSPGLGVSSQNTSPDDVFTDLSKWVADTSKAASSYTNSDTESDNDSDPEDLNILSETDDEANEFENKSDLSEDDSNVDPHLESSESSSDNDDDADDTELIFDDNQMDDFMSLV